jgi:hypothetical protein
MSNKWFASTSPTWCGLVYHRRCKRVQMHDECSVDELGHGAPMMKLHKWGRRTGVQFDFILKENAQQPAHLRWCMQLRIKGEPKAGAQAATAHEARDAAATRFVEKFETDSWWRHKLGLLLDRKGQHPLPLGPRV